jgi:hypothetical protein
MEGVGGGNLGPQIRFSQVQLATSLSFLLIFGPGVTIGRIYSQHETYEVFMKMWPGLFETIAHITKSEVKFKFIDGEGLRAILVDGNKPQANALGALVTRNRPDTSGICETDPKLIIFNILRTCIFHLERFVFLLLGCSLD